MKPPKYTIMLIPPFLKNVQKKHLQVSSTVSASLYISTLHILTQPFENFNNFFSMIIVYSFRFTLATMYTLPAFIPMITIFFLAWL